MHAPWQQWMPMYIQRLKSNPYVIAMHPAAVMGYLWLVMAQWQSDDCTLPNDVRELRVISGMGMYWQEHAEEILSRFHSVEGDRLRNQTCYELWMEAKAKYEEGQLAYEQIRQLRSEAGKVGNDKRWAEVRKNKGIIANPSQTVARATNCDRKRVAKSRLTDTVTITKTEDKTPVVEKPTTDAKSLHSECHVVINRYWHKFHPEAVLAPWDGSEGKQLQRLLTANPGLTAEGFTRLLAHRARSDVNHSERPSKWLSTLTDFSSGPLDRFGKPKGSGSGAGVGKAQERNDRSRDSIARAAQSLGIWQAPGVDGPDEGGESGPGPAGGHGDDLDARLGEAGVSVRASPIREGPERVAYQAGPEILPRTAGDSRAAGGNRG